MKLSTKVYLTGALLLVVVVAVLAGFAMLRDSTPAADKQAGPSQRLLLWGDAPSRPADAEPDESFVAPESMPSSNYKVGLDKVSRLAAGTQHFIALREDGSVWAWGSNKLGQIGNGSSTEKVDKPVKIEGLPNIKAVAASQNHSLALDNSGRVWAWGSNLSSQLGDGGNSDQRAPVQVQGLDEVTDIAAGYRFSMALRRDGSVWAWGGKCATDTDPKLAALVQEFADDLENEEGYFDPESNADPNIISRLNDCIGESRVNIESRQPKKIEGINNIIALSAGFGHMLALDKKGTVWGWGCNKYGQTGAGFLGNQTANRTPLKVSGLPRIQSVSAGFRHSLALDVNGEVWSWGQNYHGQLGQGGDKDNPKPVKLSGLPKIKQVEAAHESSFVLGEDGSIRGWGSNVTRQLGSDDKEQFERPRQVGQSDRVVSLVGSQEQAAIILDR
jgi:alpha-tubulin suppressor-like RCC1 family protein